MPQRIRGRRPRARAVAVVGGAILGVLLVLGALAIRGQQAGKQFDLLRWELETIPNRWLGAVGGLVRDEPDADETIVRYFALDPDDPARAALENEVERIVEQRIGTVLRDAGLSARISLPGTLVPPVDIELAISPRVLVVSPRTRIERRETELLRPDITLAEAEAIEADVERDEVSSALVVGSGGVATYPAIVSDRTSYRGMLNTAAHEWVHHYLFFYPLGFRYFESGDLRTINETVADLVGQEIAEIALERWGDPTQPPRPEPTATPEPTPFPEAPPAPPFDEATVLRELRLEVDALLLDGDVTTAERRMAEVRGELEANGISIRRINQAYFAWYGTYAARPDAVDPLGGYLREIRERAGSATAFLAAVRGLDSRDAVERTLVELGGTLTEE